MSDFLSCLFYSFWSQVASDLGSHAFTAALEWAGMQSEWVVDEVLE
jgi:hypothetical protein